MPTPSQVTEELLPKITDQTILVTPMGTGTMIRDGRICQSHECDCDDSGPCENDTVILQIQFDGGGIAWIPITQVQACDL